jgi:hypothetical protein
MCRNNLSGAKFAKAWHQVQSAVQQLGGQCCTAAAAAGQRRRAPILCVLLVLVLVGVCGHLAARMADGDACQHLGSLCQLGVWVEEGKMASGALRSSWLGWSVDGQVGGGPIVWREGGWRDGGEVTEPWEEMGLNRCMC